MKKHNKSRKKFKIHHYSDILVNERNRIHELPGYSKELPSKTYVSYMHLPNSEKHVHYWFVESEHDPKNAPVFFWTNGGPGCSSLMGLFEEIGPFMPDSKLKLVRNNLAWTKFANIVFVEQPIGVGFSYSKNPKDYVSNDTLAAKNNMAFLIEFFKVFPEFKHNKLYLTGESYAGHYIPMLLTEVIAHNKTHNNELNFTGCILMNPLITHYSGDQAQIETYWGFQRISHETWKKYKKHKCITAKSRYCTNLTNEINDNHRDLNPYAIDYPLCNNHHQSKKMIKFFRNYRNFTYQGINLSCVDQYAAEYLNSTAVRDKIIKPHSTRVWTPCSDHVKYRMKDGNNDMLKYIKPHLFDKTLKHFDLLIMSGTSDSICGTVGTQKWISRLKLKVKENTKEWKPYSMDGQLKGYVTEFQGDGKKTLTLVTVIDAGHEIPMFKPAEAFHVVHSYLKRETPIVQ